MKLTFKRIMSFALALAMIFTMLPQLEMRAHAATATVTTAGGNVEFESNVGSFSVSGTTVTFTNSVSGIQTGYKYTFTIYNRSDSKATLTYTTSGSPTFDTDPEDKSGTVLDPGGSITLSAVTTCWSGQSDKWILTNVLLTPVLDYANVAVEYDSACGTVATASGTLASGTTTTSVLISGGLVATPNSGYEFVAWVDTDGNIVSTNSYLSLEKDQTYILQAVFSSAATAPYFMVGTATSGTYKDYSGIIASGLATTATYYNVSGTQLFSDLNEAATYASSSDNKYIVLMNSGTLPAGTYTIPNGVTLLIPFDDANTLYTNTPCSYSAYTSPTEYRTLTMADGANLVIEGALSVSGKHMRGAAGQENCSAPTGPQGFIRMQGSSNISISSGGTLYAWGFITGSGSVTANSGATVYELFQVGDFRGGSQTLDMENKVFPLSQYYVQNIEVPLTIYAGATEYSFTTIYMSSAAMATSLAFIGADCMFNMSGGYVVKRYDGSTDRMIIDAYGTLSVSPVTMKVGTGSINTAEYVLPINSNFTVNVHSGSITLSQDIALLPGAEIYIGPSAACYLGSGNSVYLYGSENWGTYCWGGVSSQKNVKFVPVKYAPGKTYTRTEADLKDAVLKVAGLVDASGGYLYTTGSNVAIIGENGAIVKINPGTAEITYQVMQNTSGDTDTYVEIPIVPARLLNADGSIQLTNDAARSYIYKNGKWICYTEDNAHTGGEAATCTTAQTCTVCGTVLTAALGHTVVVDEAKAATCTEAGLTEGSHCSACNTVLVAQTEIPALGHTWTFTGYTWEDDGSACTANASCACGVTTSATATITKEITTAASCAAMGVTTYTATFSESWAAQTTKQITDVPMVSHSYTVEVSGTRVPATCVATGSVTMQCATCTATTVVTLEIDSANHAGDYTCTDNGDGNHTVTCNACGQVSNASEAHTYTNHVCACGAKETFTITLTGNNVSLDGNPVATYGEQCVITIVLGACYELGATNPVLVYIDGSGYVTDFELQGNVLTIPAEAVTGDISITVRNVVQSHEGDKDNDHLCDGCDTALTTCAGNCVAFGANAATCEGPGNSAYYQCSICGKYYSDDGVTEIEENSWIIGALGHTEVVDAAVAATCTTTGLTEGSHCSACGEIIVAQTVVPVLGHKAGDVVTENNVDATCAKEGSYDTVVYCSVCNAEMSRVTTTVPVLEHSYDNGVVTTEPSCETEGVKTFTCSACGHTYTEPVAATGHTEVIDAAVAATCTTTGLTEGSHCSVCKKVLVEQTVIPSQGHTDGAAVTENEVAATCTTAGSYDTVIYCTVCGVEVSRVTTTVPALGHTASEAVKENEVAATCGKAGSYDSVVYCAVCRAEISRENVTVPATGAHVYVTETERKDATCAEDGYYVMACGCGATQTTTINRTGHSYSAVVTAPTCTEDGYTTYTCSVCSHTRVGDVVAALGHTNADPVKEKEVAATCTADGSYESVVCCAECEEELSREVVTVPATGHSYESVVTAPSCTAAGYTTYTCPACGDTYIADEVAALGHTEGETVVENNVAPTCTSDGSYDNVVYCTVCRAEISRQTVTVDALGHIEGETVVENNVAPNCTDDGSYDNVVYCSVCEAELSRETITVDALGHSYDDGVVTTEPDCENEGVKTYTCSACSNTYTEAVAALGHTEVVDAAVAATCTATGLTEGKHCDVCKEVLVEQTVVDALGHTEVVDAAVDATCTETGLTQGSHCSVCKKVLIAQTVVPVLGHSYTSEVTAATCITDGYTTYTCSNCGDSYVKSGEKAFGHTDGEAVTQNVVAATCTEDGSYDSVVYCTECTAELSRETITTNKTGHSYDNGVVTTAPGCETEGVKTFTCQHDATHTYTEAVAATGHSYDNGVVTTAPGCETEGVKTFTCQNDATHTYTEAVAATGHSYDNGVITTEPGCETEGVKTFTCQHDANHTYTESVDPIGHTEGETVTENVVDASCTTDGSYDNVVYCANDCGKEMRRETVTVSATGHSWNDGEVTTEAGCLTDGVKTYTCTICSETKTETIEKLGHWMYYQIGTDPTCTESGTSTSGFCRRCGYEEDASVIPALGHNWDEGKVTAEATCTDAGVRTHTCTRCSATENREIAAKGHVEVVDSAVEATCTTDGLTEGKHCSVCNAVLVAQIEVPALGHTEVVDAGSAATCTAAGLTEGKHCSVCGAVIVAQEEIPALGHTEVVDAGAAATCTATGLTEGKHCSVCNEVIVAQEEIPATGHTEVVDSAVSATCTATGLTEGKHCSVCNEVLVAQNVTEKLPHEIESVVTAPTCEIGGYTTNSCKNCTYSYTSDRVNPLGHDHKAVVTASTCTEEGYTTYTCSTCGDTYTENITAVLGHSYDDGVVTTDPDCETAGVKTFTCTRANCGASYTETVAALGHTEVVDEAVAATCTTTGLTEGKHCDVCGEVLVEQTVVPALGHTDGAAVKENEVAATCTTDGSYDTVVYCSVCGTETSRETTTVPALCHDYDDGVVSTEPNCETEGVKTFTCATCGNTYTEAVAATGHSYESVVTAPTCTKAGFTTYTCSVCGNSYVADEVDKLGHSYESVVTAPTCTEAGFTTYTCSVCGDAYVADKVAELGHNYESVVTAPACNAKGYTTHTCSVCGYSYRSDETSATGHKYEPTVTAPTCTEAGYTTYTCSACDDSYTDDEIAALGHTSGDPVKENEKGATCTADGSYESVVYCSVCDAELSREEVTVPAAGHSYEAAVTAPTCTEEGYTTYTCSVCGDTYTAGEVAALGHTEGETVVENNVDPTCTEDGSYDNVVYCTVCDAELSRETITVPALGHTEGETVVENEVAPTCTADGSYDNVVYCSVCDAEVSRETITVPALGHTEGETVTENNVAPTCTEDGSYDNVVYCTVCDAELSRTTVTVSATGHSYEEAVTAPTCTAAGYTTYTCSVCGDSYVADEVAALGHTEGEAVIENEVAATCTEAGSYDTVVYCSVCNEELSRETIVVDPLGHSFVEIDCKWAKDYTSCTLVGECVRCPELFISEMASSAEQAKAPTCTEMGDTTYTVDFGVTWAEIKTVTVTDIPATGHLEWTVAYTWETDYSFCIATRACKACGHTESETAEATITTTEPTCTENGSIVYSVAFTADWANTEPKTVEIPANGHTNADPVVENEVPATCVTSGSYDLVIYCSVCNAEVSRETGLVIEPTGEHSYTVEQSRTPATCMATGSVTWKCATCDAVITETLEVDPENHTGNNTTGVGAKPATCLEDGYTGDTVCECGTTVEFGEVIDALGHSDPDRDHVCNNGCGITQGIQGDSPNDNDHVCDYCRNEILEKCTDKDGDFDHACDVCGEENITEHTYTKPDCLSPATCTECLEKTGEALGHKDADLDHVCDHGCGVYQGVHEDANMDHQCDYGCSVQLGECVDSEEDNDHICDYSCGKELNPCSDRIGDGDHDCDVCGAEDYSACFDSASDDDHNCDDCGLKLSECEDVEGDNDHLCDICGAENITACSGGTANCQIAATCDECGNLYGQIDPDNHTSDASYLQDNGNGTHTRHYECCGAAIETEAHAYTDGLCKCGNICTYTVSFLIDGETWKTAAVKHGGAVNISNIGIPTKEGYTFVRWVYEDGTAVDETVENIVADMNICAEWILNTDIYYLITWVVDGVTIYQEMSFTTVPVYGLGEDPVKAVDADNHYTFAGWSLTENGKVLETLPAVTGDATYYAVFTVGAHADTDDHLCDTCGYVMSVCGDVLTDDDHDCDICGEKLSSCADVETPDHNCDICGEKMTECVDEDTDYICDWCGAEIPRGYIRGDMDNDGDVDSYDAIYLLYYTFYPEDYPIYQSGDLDGDGDVDSYDSIYLLYFTFYPDDYPLSP